MLPTATKALLRKVRLLGEVAIEFNWIAQKFLTHAVEMLLFCCSSSTSPITLVREPDIARKLLRYWLISFLMVNGLRISNNAKKQMKNFSLAVKY